MNTQTPTIFMNPQAHFMEPGSVAFIPGWIILLLVIFTFGIMLPQLFSKQEKSGKIINSFFFAFIVGSLMPVCDDLLAFVFGPPFAHHSLFHSMFGPIITYTFFRLIATNQISKYAFWGNISHIFFNFYFDYIAIFFPFTYREFGLTDITGLSTYWIKAIHYPIIMVLFIYSLIKFFLSYKKEKSV